MEPSQAGTGRIVGQLGQRSQGILYGALTPERLDAELSLVTQVDRAHVVMLAERGLAAPDVARRLLCAIEELATQRYAPLVGRAAPRGVYLLYERYLIERLGPDVGGVLHTGRSRNDLNATATNLRLREWVLDFSEQAVRLYAVLLAGARRHRRVLMPVYTHFQAAMPITYGYYLLGVAVALGRDIAAVQGAAGGLRQCPLGAGAAAGTDLPIDGQRTAALLGFSETTRHALDAVATRDVVLRLLGVVAGMTITLSRLASDLQLWSTAEFDLVRFPDRLVGSSSAMPQKRNAFLLEHVRAKAGQAVGAWSAAASVMRGAPFTNSIEVGTGAVASAWCGLEAARDAVLLSQTLVAAAHPVLDRMRQRVTEGFTTASWLANRLVESGVPFRTAHHAVGAAVREAVAAGSIDLAAFGPPGWLDGVGAGGPDPDTVVAAQRYGGGPGAFDSAFAPAVVAWEQHRDWHVDWRGTVHAAARALSDAVNHLSGRDAG